MPTKAELQQELEIRDAEYDKLSAELRAAQEENERLRAQGGMAITRTGSDADDVSDAPPETRAELELLRRGVDRDLQALDELRRPPLSADPMESTLDIVRANQRERAELQERTKRANSLLSRVAGAVGLDRWDDESELLERIAKLTTTRLKMNARLKDLKRLAPQSDSAYVRGQIDILEWALHLFAERPAFDPTKLRRLELVVAGNPLPVHCKPEWTVAEVREAALSIQYPHGAEPPVPVEQWLIYDEAGVPLNLEARVRELVLPSERVIVTTPIGVGG